MGVVVQVVGEVFQYCVVQLLVYIGLVGCGVELDVLVVFQCQVYVVVGVVVLCLVVGFEVFDYQVVGIGCEYVVVYFDEVLYEGFCVESCEFMMI